NNSMTTQRERRARKMEEPKGHDFGVKVRSIVLGSMDFTGNLSKAQINGVAYGYMHEPSLRTTVPVLTLLGSNPEPLHDAFEEFATWNKQSDGDAVELTLVFLRSGGYLVGISPEAERLLQRTMHFDTTYENITAMPTWVKPIESVGPETIKFRSYKNRLVSPFLLGAAWYNGASDSLRSDRLPKINPIGRPLLKFEASVFDEVDVQPGTIADAVMKVGGERTAGTA